MNSEGIKDPYPIYSTEDENIKKIYKVIVNADPLEMEDWRPPRLRVMKPEQKDQQTQTKDEIIFKEDICDKYYMADVSTITKGHTETIQLLILKST